MTGRGETAPHKSNCPNAYLWGTQMGEAKRRVAAGAYNKPNTVFHHTSTLRTNLIWMSGVIDIEGRSPPVVHPRLGVLQGNPFGRRAFKDFPPVAGSRPSAAFQSVCKRHFSASRRRTVRPARSG